MFSKHDLLTRLACSAVEHGGEAVDFLFDVDNEFLDVRSSESAAIAVGLETLVPDTAMHVREGLHLGGGDDIVAKIKLCPWW